MNLAEDDGLGKTVVFIDSGYSVDLEISKYVSGAFAALGYGFEEYSLNDPQFAVKLGELLQTRIDDVLCFVSLNYYAAVVHSPAGHLLHHATGVPLVFSLMDHPLYFLGKQLPENAGAMVFVLGPDLIDFVGKYFPPGTVAIDNQAFEPPPFEERPLAFDDFMRRHNAILCPMNLSIWGQTMDVLWAAIRELPAPRRDFIKRLIEVGLTDVFTPLHVLAESLPRDGRTIEQQMTDGRFALDFIKVWRRNHMIRALIDLPIRISTEYVPADLAVKYPDKFTLWTIQETMPLYQQYRFVLNSSPLMTYAIHDRIFNALVANAVVITDQNNMTSERFTDGVDALFYDYSTGDIANKIARYIDDPRAAYDLTVNAYDLRVRRNAFTFESYANLIEAVKQQKRARRV
jgi:hypothetical protein